MMRTRRLVSVAAAASLALGGLTACSVADPQVAVYFGDTAELTGDRVQHLLDDAQAKTEQAYAERAAELTKQQGEPVTAPPVQLKFGRSDVVRYVLQTDVLDRLAKKMNLTLPAEAQLSIPEDAARIGIPATADLAAIYSRGVELGKIIQDAAAPAGAPTEADIKQVYAGFVAAGLPDGQYQEFKSGLSPQQLQIVSAAANTRSQIQATAHELKIKVNPKYGPMVMDAFKIPASASSPEITIATAGLEGVDLSVPVTEYRQ